MGKIETITLQDQPICPECNTCLQRGLSYTEPSDDNKYWYCTGCHTVWSTPDLITALNDVEDLACMMAAKETGKEEMSGERNNLSTL